MAFSSEIEDLEQFIDSYVGPESRTSSSEWQQMNSFHENQSFGNVQVVRSDTGTEYWGKQADGPQWMAPQQTREVHQQWNERRPKIQDRQAEQWQQPVGFPQQHQPTFSCADNSQWEGNPALQQMSAAQAHGSNDIQAIVSNLIRQNNMSKANEPSQLPPWVDTSKPPPPLQGQMPQFEYQNEPYANQLDLQGREPILQSMTFQRSANDAMYPTQASPVQFGQRTATPDTQSHYPPEFSYRQHQPMPEMMQPGQSLYYQPQMVDPRGSPGVLPPQAYDPGPAYQQQVFQGTPFPQTSQAIDTGGYNANIDHSERQQPPTQQYEQQTFEAQTVQQQIILNTDRHLSGDAGAQNLNHQNQPTQMVLKTVDSKPSVRLDNDKNKAMADKKPLNRKSSNEKYPNSMVRLTVEPGHGKEERSHERPNSEVFEDESDDRWRTHNFKVHVNHKKNTRRTSSAADDDPDWRRRDSEESQQSRKNHSDSDRRHSSSDSDKRNQKQNATTQGRNNNDTRQRKDQFHRKRSDTDNSDVETHRRVTARGKNTVHSWLENGVNVGNGEQDLRRLRISDSEADLTKFIEATQSFATNEAKMREVAEILCNKALKNPKFSRNASVLCDRMSWMMVQGTKFRSVVLNVMQGHYKNRGHLFSATFRSDRRWFGFATFMVEIFLNVRTAKGDRLIVLNEPVFQCLLQVLKSDHVTQEHVNCFGNLFARVGPALEKENQSRMNELLAEVRDRCVISKTSHTRQILLRCVELYATKWQKNDK